MAITKPGASKKKALTKKISPGPKKQKPREKSKLFSQGEDMRPSNIAKQMGAAMLKQSRENKPEKTPTIEGLLNRLSSESETAREIQSRLRQIVKGLISDPSEIGALLKKSEIQGGSLGKFEMLLNDIMESHLGSDDYLTQLESLLGFDKTGKEVA